MPINEKKETLEYILVRENDSWVYSNSLELDWFDVCIFVVLQYEGCKLWYVVAYNHQ